jgi:tetratricopeptide (TPR) repeat protein
MNALSRWYYPIRWFILLGLGVAIYYQVFGFGFVFDDDQFIVFNTFIRSFDSVDGLWAQLPRTRTIGIYSFVINFLLNGLNPQGYHIFNFLVHLIATGLVWGLAALIFRIAGIAGPAHPLLPAALPNGTLAGRTKISSKHQRKQAQALNSKAVKNNVPLQPTDWLGAEIPFLIALLFLVHPCQTQAVTYITQRFESMATVFYLAAVFFYLHARIAVFRINQILFFTATGLAIYLGILTKEVTFTIPLMLFASEWILKPAKSSIKPVSGKIPAASKRHWWLYPALAAGATAFFLFFYHLLGSPAMQKTIVSESHDGDILTTGRYLLTQMRVFLTFLRLLIFPVNQNLEYDYPMSTGILSPPLTLVGICAIGTIAWLIVRLRRNWPVVAFGLAWILITFSINLAPRSNVIFEHKLYLISFGFFLALGAALHAFVRPRGAVITLLVAAIAVLAVMTYQRNPVWSNEQTIWEDVAKKSPHKARIIANLGKVYCDVKKYDLALTFLNKAIALKADDYTSYVNRGNVYLNTGRNDLALQDYNKALAINSEHFAIYINRAQVFHALGRDKEAFADLDTAVGLHPEGEFGYRERGILFVKTGQPPEGIRDLQQTLSIDPEDVDALIYRGIAYYCLQKKNLAFADWMQAKTLAPGNAQASNLLTFGKAGVHLQECQSGKLSPSQK